jgi:hypothetical protein
MYIAEPFGNRLCGFQLPTRKRHRISGPRSNHHRHPLRPHLYRTPPRWFVAQIHARRKMSQISREEARLVSSGASRWALSCYIRWPSRTGNPTLPAPTRDGGGNSAQRRTSASSIIAGFAAVAVSDSHTAPPTSPTAHDRDHLRGLLGSDREVREGLRARHHPRRRRLSLLCAAVSRFP